MHTPKNFIKMSLKKTDSKHSLRREEGEIRKRLKIEGNPVRNENFHSHKLMWANYFPS